MWNCEYYFDCYGEFNPYSRYCVYQCPYGDQCEEWAYDNDDWWW